MKYSPNEGQRVSSKVFGSGELDIVLVHGISANKETWSGVVAELLEDKNYRIHIIDLLGHGSRVEEQSPIISIESQSEFLEAYLSANTSGRTVVVGHSYGGLVVLMNQLSHPKVSREVILINSPVFGGDFPLFVEYFRRPILFSIVNFLTTTNARVRVALSQLYEDDTRITNETVDRYVSLIDNAETRNGIISVAKGINKDALQSYIQLYPGLVGRLNFIRSTGDTVTSPGILKMVSDVFPISRIEVISGCGHNVHEECPKRTADAISLLIDGAQ